MAIQWDIVDKEMVDEIIFRTTNVRNRLMLELMARGGMRVGEVLNLTPRDIQERTLAIQNPKSGRTGETVYVPRKILVRLTGYVRAQNIDKKDRIFPISGAEKQKRPAANWFQDAAWNQFFLGTHIMIQRFNGCYSTRTPTPRVFTDIDSCLCVYADSHGFRISIRQRIQLPDVFKDCVGFRCFFCTLLLATVRNR
jgi:hypothetical protein